MFDCFRVFERVDLVVDSYCQFGQMWGLTFGSETCVIDSSELTHTRRSFTYLTYYVLLHKVIVDHRVRRSWHGNRDPSCSSSRRLVPERSDGSNLYHSLLQPLCLTLADDNNEGDRRGGPQTHSYDAHDDEETCSPPPRATGRPYRTPTMF